MKTKSAPKPFVFNGKPQKPLPVSYVTIAGKRYRRGSMAAMLAAAAAYPKTLTPETDPDQKAPKK